MPGTANAFFWTKTQPYLLSIVRIVFAFMFIQHGGNKLLGFPGHDHLVFISPHMLPTLAPGLAGILELGGGFLLLIGLFTRPIAFILSGEMAFAYFLVDMHNGGWPFHLIGGMSVAFCFAFLFISAAGPGPWSLDRLRGRA
ncbi:MAG TPA: DoxX family protein [Rhodanobacteraceae bacterium]